MSDPRFLNTTNQHNNQHNTVFDNDGSVSATTSTSMKLDDDEKDVVLPPSSSAATTTRASNSSSEVLYLHVPLIPFTPPPLDLLDVWRSERPIVEPPAFMDASDQEQKDSMDIHVVEDLAETNQVRGMIARLSTHPHGTEEISTSVRLLCHIDGPNVHGDDVQWHASDYHEMKSNGVTFAIEFAPNQFQAAAVHSFRMTLVAQEIPLYPYQLEEGCSNKPVFKSSYKTFLLPPLLSVKFVGRYKQCFIDRLNEAMNIKGTSKITDLDNISVAAITEINKVDNAVRQNSKSSGATSRKRKATLEVFGDGGWIWRPPQDS